MPCLLLLIFESLFDELDVLEAQLLAYDVEIAGGVDVALDVDDFSIVETADNLENRINRTNV